MKVLILINKVGLGDCIIHINYIHEISKKYGKPVSILAKENNWFYGSNYLSKKTEKNLVQIAAQQPIERF